MTAPMEWEIEAEPVEASHLVRTKCHRCGAGNVLATAEIAAARTARCGACMVTDSNAVAGTGIVGPSVPGPVVGFPFVRQDAPTEVDHEPHPEPEYVGRWGSVATRDRDVATPQPPLLLAERAREAGWEVEMRYSRGTAIHASQARPLGVRHMIALRFAGHSMTDRVAVAVYESNVSTIAWSWSSIWVIGADIGYRGELGVEQLKVFLERPDECSPAWFGVIVKAAGEAAARVKLRAKMKPCPEGCEVDHEHKAAPRKREAKHGA